MYIFKTMLVPICEECFKKFIRKRTIIPPPKQEPGMPVKEYFKQFEMFVLGECIPINSAPARNIFIDGLTNENKEEVKRLSLGFLSRTIDENYIKDLVNYLSSVEDFKDVIFGKKDLGPMDVV